MKRPSKRPDLPARQSDNDRRRLIGVDEMVDTDKLLSSVHYEGSAKHKRHPHLYRLPPYTGERGDATLCDSDGQFLPKDMPAIPGLLRRGIRARLIGVSQRILWTVADNGWIFECRLTNISQGEYHGYPVRPSEAIALPVYQRFAEWTTRSGSLEEKRAAAKCKALYGFV
jgi:hypothetical protein